LFVTAPTAAVLPTSVTMQNSTRLKTFDMSIDTCMHFPVPAAFPI
jgi:hypothetical protein